MNLETLKQLTQSYPFTVASDDGFSVITAPVRLAFVHFAKPYKPPNSKKEARYGCSVIVPEFVDWSVLKAAAKAAWAVSPIGAAGNAPPKEGLPFKLQAEAKTTATATRPSKHYEGFAETGPAIWFRAETKEPFPVFGMDLMPMDVTAAYSGMWARVKVRAKAYPSIDGGKPGVKFWLQSVQMVADDTKFASIDPTSGFTALAPAGVAPAQTPATNGAAGGVW